MFARFRPLTLLGLVAIAVIAGGCVEDPLPTAEMGHYQVGTQSYLHIPRREVDLLFVVDDSISMADKQALLALNFGAYAEVLTDEEVAVDVRVALTTSTVGGPSCDAAEPAGSLRLSSCTERLEDFESEGLDLRASGCLDSCSLDTDALQIAPSALRPGGESHPRPWLELGQGHQNLPATTEPSEALACFGPQGIAGCEFESPLEAMYQALMRSFDRNDPAYGFLRPHAHLMVVFITDEVDCSLSELGAEILDPEGLRSFWSDPEAAAPSSAVCWNAGVSCSGDAENYDSCVAVDKAADGSEGVDASEAVLRPTQRYLDLLAAIEADKRVLEPNARVIVSLVGGVGPSGEPFYGDALEPEFQAEYGIGPGCLQSAPGEPTPLAAVPPVRLLELTERFAPGNGFSICEADHSQALEALAPSIRWPLRPACFDYCAADMDRSTLALEPACVVEHHDAGGETHDMLECVRDEQGYVLGEDEDYQLPAGAQACYALRTGRRHEAEPQQWLSDVCEDQGYNLELAVRRTTPASQGSYVSLSCMLSPHPTIDCPQLE